ncbi:hypothetical protein EJ02DRAFT_503682 [Clathrospora elynae]|uniref:Small ribosomal subunit protein uS15 N-terminal domain-containing protein n=1 Tax=Clathrospora elynae TaxID=706981 RepID=A0A6A5SN26_9PLEO|nr:hypothetical protein EJ02DRAFT_503682 [Clathrospora elynae]
MSRLHSNTKGISASAIPYSRTTPAWSKATPEAGAITLGLAPEIPEGLYMLIKKAVCRERPDLINRHTVAISKHLGTDRKDKDGKFRLILVESRIHYLSRYYKAVGTLPPTWRYESSTASTMMS